MMAKRFDRPRRFRTWTCAAAIVCAVLAAPGPARAGFDGVLIGPTLFAYNYSNDHLVCFSASAPSTLMRDIPLTGLASTEFLLGIDFRPATRELYAVATSESGDRVVTIDTETGAVTPVAAGFIATTAGGYFGLAFSPLVDRMRLVSNVDSNVRLNPTTGAISATDTNLAYAVGDPGFGSNPDVVHVAYTNARAGASSTTLFGIDVARDVLVLIGGVNGSPSPNGGLLTTIGPLGLDAASSGGFGIDPTTGAAWAALRVGGVSQLYSIDLATGAAALVGSIGSGGDFDGLAVPEPGAAGAALAAAAVLHALRRRRAARS